MWKDGYEDRKGPPENTTLRMLCSVVANPAVTGDVLWYLNDTLLKKDEAEQKLKINLNESSLTIDRVDPRLHDGAYSCLAANSEGRTMSNKVDIKVSCKFDDMSCPLSIIIVFVADAPRCSNVQYIYGVGLNETVDIECRVDADPPVVYFEWLVNKKPNLRYSHSNSYLESRLHFMATNRHQFGTVECHAQNSVGEMATPCVYKVIPYNPPDVPRVCSVVNLTRVNHTDEHDVNLFDDSGDRNISEPGYTVSCEYDWDGGLDTVCMMSIYRANDSLVVWNETNAAHLKMANGGNVCIFNVPKMDLDPEVEFRFNVFTENRAGRSHGKAYENLFSHSILTAQRLTLTPTELDSFEGESLVATDHSQKWASTNQVIIIVVIIGIFSVVVFGLIYTVISVFVLYRMDAKLKKAAADEGNNEAIPMKPINKHGSGGHKDGGEGGKRVHVHVNHLDPYNQSDKHDSEYEEQETTIECFSSEMTLEQCQQIIEANFTPVPLNLVKEFEEAEGFADVAELVPEIFFQNAGEFV